MISSFQGEYRFLSNFWPAVVVLDGVEYPTVEHAYQAAKTLDHGVREEFRAALSPGAAKRLGRGVVRRPDWESVKLGIMESLVRQKFCHPALALQLLDTRGEMLVEGNSWGDRFWGRCNGTGENHLGKILMQVRAELATVR